MKNKISTIILALLLISTWIYYLTYKNAKSEANLLKKAHHFYSINNYEKAQKYYEKAFYTGSSDLEARSNYSKILLDSQISVDNLEKMAKFTELPVNDIAKDDIESFLYEKRRNVFKEYPGNYASQALYNNKVLRWGKMPIRYAFALEAQIPEYYTEEVKDAFQTWENMTDKAVSFIYDNSKPDIIIKFTENTESNFESGKLYVLAYTSPVLNFSTLEKMVISFYPKSLDGEYYTRNQIYNTALHEIEHALGVMGHSSSRKNILYIAKDQNAYINDERRELSQADINTVKLLYRTKPDITNIMPEDCEYVPYLIAGSGDDIFNSKIEEARNYIIAAPNLPNGYVDMAANYVSAKEYTKALKYLEKALELTTAPDQKDKLFHNIAIVYYKNGDYNSALESLNAIKKYDNYEEFYSFMADIYTKQGNTEKAIQIYKDLISKNPKRPEYSISLTNIYVKRNNYFKARAVLKELFRNNPAEKSNPKYNNYGIVKMFL